MIELGSPWWLLLLPVPLLIWWLLPPYRESRASLRVPFFGQVAKATGLRPAPGAVIMRRNWLQWLLAPLAWALLVIALARPQVLEPPKEKVESARDLLLAVDLSGSMDTPDFQAPDGSRINRLEAVKMVLADFVDRRRGDRIGVLLFGDSAHLQVPFTLDHETVLALIAETQLGMVGPRTMIGDAIGFAINLYEETTAEHRTLVLLTDGNDTGSRVPPARAAEIAADRDITIHVVGMGDPATGGNDVVDVQAMQTIASATGGEFFLAIDTAQLQQVYRQLNEIEPQDFETLSYRPRRDLFHYPAGAALLLALLYHGIMGVRRLVTRRTAHA